MILKHKEKILEWLVVAILLGGVAYAAMTSWKNETRLATVGEDVKSIKRSMMSLLLDDAPDKAGIAKDLLGSNATVDGIESFKVGDYEKALTTWTTAAEAGDRDAIYAIAVANDALREKAASLDTSEPQRQELIRVLELVPEISEKSGVYMLRNSSDMQ